jgi:Protein of unknown function (DUF3070)
VLDLLSDAATESPLLLVAEDAHWLDRPSVDVLGFVARRLESDPIVVLAAAREGYPDVFSTDELPELRLQPLDPASATRLLEAAIIYPPANAAGTCARLQATRWLWSSCRRSRISSQTISRCRAWFR